MRSSPEPALPTLLWWLLHALMRRGVGKIPARVRRRIIIPCCGFIGLVTPLLLWISWSKAGLFIILSVGGAAMTIIFILVWFGPEDYF